MSEVYLGKEGHYFLTGSVHKILSHMEGHIVIPEASRVNFYHNLQSREEYCNRHGIGFKHVIYPDKLTCLKSLTHFDDLRSFTDNYRSYFTSSVVDLTPVLKGRADLFFKTDTHLNFYGKVETTIHILSHLIENFPITESRDVLNDLKGDEFNFTGDLGGKINPIVTENDFNVKSNFLKRFHNQVGANDGFTVVCMNKRLLMDGVKRRLLIFGDSFAERTLQLLSYFYSEILFCRTRYFHSEIVDMFKPDVVFSESAERYFSSVRTDDLASRFFLIYGQRGFKYSDNVEFYNALNAQLNYDSIQYNRFISKFLSEY